MTEPTQPGPKMSVTFTRPLRDDEWFDQVEILGLDGKPIVSIITAPRYKTSGLSGDEWRISGVIRVHDAPGAITDLSHYLNVETSCQAVFPNLYYHRKPLLETMTVGTVFARKGEALYLATDEGRAATLLIAAACLPWSWIIAREDGKQPRDADSKCFQPGCSQVAVSTYKLKELFSRSGQGPLPDHDFTYLRKFCARHLRRGDCGREDADHNYEVVEGPGPDQAKDYGEFISESAFGGVIDAKDLGI